MERSLATRAALTVVPVLAVLGVWMLAWPGHAEARANLLAGSPRIDTIRALIPRQGRHAGRLVVWVRVFHATGTRRALGRERPETVHAGRMVARVGKASRVATEQVDLDGRRLTGGYHFRFSRSATRAAAAGTGGRVSVSVRMAQTVDLDSDGDSEDRAPASATRRVALARPAISFEPRDGYYTNGPDDYLRVVGAHVVAFGFLSPTESPCEIGLASPVYAPIDPQTGLFSFTDISTYADTVTTTVLGDFRDATSSVVDATISVRDCNYRIVPSTFDFRP
jgi:hypothetical protein